MGKGREIIPGVLSVVHRHSSGFAFGLLNSPPEKFHQLFLLGVPAFALVLVILIFIKLRDDQLTTSIALTTIFSGAIGNLIDRLQFGYVIDFLDIGFFGGVKLPSLNVADAAIITGVVIMLVNTIRQQVRDGYRGDR